MGIRSACSDTHKLITQTEALHATLLQLTEDCSAYAAGQPPECLLLQENGAVDPKPCVNTVQEAKDAQKALDNQVFRNRALIEVVREIGHQGFIGALASPAKWSARLPS